ncbi:DUF3106 domain-containing protein [Ideonella sp. YS5]|uniref:DUF3106 domain-containing protein n=1 Tax=Ideonella sp. YS5 TaxID=3453714 RepID=UPI003EEBEB26
MIRGFPLAAACLSVALSWPVLAAAQGPAGGPAWTELSPDQQTALAPLKNDWNSLDTGRKQKWLEVASRFGSMKPERQERVRERMTEWARLSPSQRTEARVNYQQSKQLPPEDRQARWEAYQALSPEERAALAARARPPVNTAPSSPAQALRRAPVDAQLPKSNIVAPNRAVVPPLKPVAPTVVQGNPGATTTLVTATPKPPPHQQPGQPKIAATPKLVDKTTLLPKSGPQAAGTSQKPARPGGPAQGSTASKPQ